MFINTANADPTNRVARLSNMSGAVTYSPAGVDKWVYAALNHPMITGDKLWVDNNARAELQMGSAAVRLWSKTYLSLLNFNDKTAQFQLNQGSINLNIHKIKEKQIYEIDTPSLAFMVIEPGVYRVDVDPDGKTTTISIQRGQGTVYDNKNASYTLKQNNSYIFSGQDLSTYKTFPLARQDDFDKWCTTRDGHLKKYHTSNSAKYVSSDVIGAEDLDDQGTWQSSPTYGNVWIPNQVPTGWAPYSNGSWVWVDQYGWTWVDNASWGFAPYHYGRWVYFRDHWAWVPGPPDVEPVYAPALVVFFGGNNFNVTVSFGQTPGIGWFPLGPGDVYIPPYPVSNNYFNTINISNTVINNTIINNYYNNPNQVIAYRNRNIPNAITVTPVNSFVNSHPIKPGLAILPKNISTLPISNVAKVTPTISSITGGEKPAEVKPSPQILNRPVIAKTTPATIVPFEIKQPNLAQHPGVPLAPHSIVAPKISGLSNNNIHVINPQNPIITPSELRPSNVITPPEHNKPQSPLSGVITKPSAPSENNIPHPPGVIIPPEHKVQPSDIIKKPDVQPSTITPPHPPGVIIPNENKVNPSDLHTIKPRVPEDNTPTPLQHPVDHVRPNALVQPHQDQNIQEQQRAQEQQQRTQELAQQRDQEQQQHAQELAQQRAQEQQQRAQELAQQRAQEQQQRAQELSQQRAQEQQQRAQELSQQRAQEQQQRAQELAQQRAQEQQQRAQELAQQRAQEQQQRAQELAQQQAAQEEQQRMQQQHALTPDVRMKDRDKRGPNDLS